MRWMGRPRGLVALVGLTGVACVDSFDGSKVELFLGGGVHVPSDENPGRGRPPGDTHYELYAVKDNAVFKLIEFEIRPVIDEGDPCFIEDEESRFPGLHATRYAEKLREALTTGGHTPDQNEAGDIFLADKRMLDMDKLREHVRSVTSFEHGLSEADRAELYTAAGVLDAAMTDEASNASRLEACNRVFAEHPLMYVGNDKVFSLPLNGFFYGVVDGMDPRNNAYISGAFFDVHFVLDDFDALRINWNFNDEYPCPQGVACDIDPDRANYDDSEIGYHYMAGVPVQRTRGVINVPMRHNDFASISGEIAVFGDLATDDIQF